MWQQQNPKVTKKPRQTQLFFSPKKSNHSFFLSPKKPFFSSLPLSSSPSVPPPKHHRHRNQSLPEKKGKTRQWIRKLKRAKDLFNINNTHCQRYHKISYNINIKLKRTIQKILQNQNFPQPKKK